MDASGHLLAEKVQALSDVELAVLLCLITDQHCIINTGKSTFNDVKQELKLITSDVFGITCALLDCTEQTTLDDFGDGILVKNEGEDYFGTGNKGSRSNHTSPPGSPNLAARRASSRPFSPLDNRKIANIVVVTGLNFASNQVQVQALELMRGKRNFSRTAVHTAPKPFLFIALNVIGSQRLTTHLNDQFFISHKHNEGDVLVNLESLRNKEIPADDNASTSSVVHTPLAKVRKGTGSAVLFSPEDLTNLTSLTKNVKISSEVRAYLHDIVVFMRLHRAVGGGISALATRHFNTLAHALAPLHSLSFVTPSLVALASRKIYPHRIIVTDLKNERSMQWGSTPEAVKAVLEGVTAEDVVEEVLVSVEAPL